MAINARQIIASLLAEKGISMVSTETDIREIMRFALDLNSMPDEIGLALAEAFDAVPDDSGIGPKAPDYPAV